MKKIIVTLLSISAVLAAKTATAQTTSDLGTWSSVQLVKSFGAPYAMARLEHRSYDHVQATECWFAMAGGGYNFNSWLKGDLSYEYWQIPAAGGITQHKAVLRRRAASPSTRRSFASRKPSSAKAWPLRSGRSTNWPTIRMQEHSPIPSARGSAANTEPPRADGPLT